MTETQMRIKLLLAQGAPRLLLQLVPAGLGRAAAELCLWSGYSQAPSGARDTKRLCPPHALHGISS